MIRAFATRITLPFIVFTVALVAALMSTIPISVEAFSTLSRSFCRSAARNEVLTLEARPKSKWDLLDDDEDDEDLAAPAIESKIPVPNDMTYVERNVKRAHENFLAIRNIGGKNLCHDVYAKSPLAKEELWYVGKAAKVSDVSLEDCIARQWNLIETHATNLRPIELFPHRGSLELWTAPGDTELDVAYNRPTLKMTKMEKYAVDPKQLKNNLLGFQGEVYQENEEGFRTWRKEDGSPARPEINPGGETRPPTEDEMKQLMDEMEQRNINVEDLYKAQQEKNGQ